MYNKKVEEQDDEKKENKKKKKKGFTLIELLAVIIILGVLMIIAVPSVTKYINDSRRNGYITTARNVTEGVRNLAYSGTYDLDDKNTTYYVEGSCIKTDNGYRSPYGDFEKAYVAVIAKDDGYEYYWTSVDSTGTGVKNLTKVDKLDIENIENNISSEDITTSVGIDGRSKIIVIGGDNCTKSAPIEATKMMNGTTGKIKAGCPETYTATIYWAISNNKLTISDSEVSGDVNGSFAGNTVFSSVLDVPWIATYNYYRADNLSYNVSSVEVVGTVAPISTAYWFYAVGYNAQSFNADLDNLEMCRVTNMTSMFENVAYNSSSFNTDLSEWDVSRVNTMYNALRFSGNRATTWSVGNLGGWNTRSVTNMYGLFDNAGANTSSWSVGNIGNWNVSNVTTMENMFYSAAYSSSAAINMDLSHWNVSNVTTMESMFSSFGNATSSFSLNVSGWNTGNVTEMDNMFQYAGSNATTWSIIGLNGWDTSKVEDMSTMFEDAGANATTFNLDLSNWDTSNVISMSSMFNSAGQRATTFNLNISGWNMSKARYINNMFLWAGENAQNYNIIIPRTNGNGLNNTTSALYGRDSNEVATPAYTKSFTLAN